MCFHEAIQFETYDIKVRDKDVIESSKMLSLSISRSHSSIRVCFRLSSLSPSSLPLCIQSLLFCLHLREFILPFKLVVVVIFVDVIIQSQLLKARDNQH